MSYSKDMLMIKGMKFIEDFTALNSSSAETYKVLKKVGLSGSVFNNWKQRMVDGKARVNAETYQKLIDVSGLSYDDYFIEKTTLSKKKTTVAAPKVKQTRMKNGIVVTTYSSTKTSDSKTSTDSNNSSRDEFKSKISSFKNHMVVYRKLLGLSTSDMENSYGISKYSYIEKGDEVLSVSTYFKICNIFMGVYGRLPESSLKSGFIDLASAYNDICIRIIYFGTSTKKGGK